ncbi:MAG: hypothetical protein AUG51_11720 [Acidobacteria bacterium 13_1_20CM_3_53_8]|nr:MAG: hypothetical protein AUG51_11720 [Acidobacteria bacterium 13_1_20CM_3_53_8]
MKNIVLRCRLIIVAASLACFCHTPVQAQTPDFESLAEAKAISFMADAALTEFTIGPDAAGHKAVLDKALAVAIFPNLRRTSFYIRSRTYGLGLVTRRTREGWSAPAFYTVKNGRWGFGFGTSRDDLIILFLNEDAINQLSKRKFRLGSEASKEMISYSKSDGFNAGVKLRGAVVRPNDTLTEAASGGLERLDVLFTQPKEALAVAKTNGTDIMLTRLTAISPAVALAGTVYVHIKVANKTKSYYVYLHEAGPTFHIEPQTNGPVEGGKITSDPPVEQWTPQLTIVPDENSEWHVERLPKATTYHFVCVEQKDRYKELILDKDCVNDCLLTCSDVSPPQTTTPSQKPRQQKGGKPKRKK